MRTSLLACLLWSGLLLLRSGMYPLVQLSWAAANAVVFLAFAWDKLAALRGRRRLSNQLLKKLGVLAPLGASAAMLLMRHKTRQPGYLAPIAVGVCLAALIARAHG